MTDTIAIEISVGFKAFLSVEVGIGGFNNVAVARFYVVMVGKCLARFEAKLISEWLFYAIPVHGPWIDWFTL